MAVQPGWVEAQLAARTPPRGLSVLNMRWEHLLFLHWRWDVRAVQATLPAGLMVDTFDGTAWLGIVPFFMRRVHPPGLPCVPGLSDFLELNVRTYVRDARNVPGVWFYSLSCNQPLAVALARRLFHLNYVHARMSARVSGETVFYESFRPRSPLAKFRYRPAGVFRETEPGSLEFFLAERYVLYSVNSEGRLFSGKVHHVPYATAPAEVSEWSFQPAGTDGFFSPDRAADHALCAADLQVKAWSLAPV